MIYLANLSNEELFRHADNNHSPLATTPLETELSKRLVWAEEEINAAKPWLEVLSDLKIDLDLTKDIEMLKYAMAFADKYDLTQAGALVDAAAAEGIYTDKELTALVEMANKYESATIVVAELNTFFPTN